MKVVGIDYSTTSPAICVFDSKNGEFSPETCRFEYCTYVQKYAREIAHNITGKLIPKFSDDPHNLRRYSSLCDWAIDLCAGSDAVAIEGYSMGSRGRVFHIGENTGILKHEIFLAGHNLRIYSPSEVKKHASGKGNASKEIMELAFVEKTGCDYRSDYFAQLEPGASPVGDIIDAYFVASLAVSHLSR